MTLATMSQRNEVANAAPAINAKRAVIIAEWGVPSKWVVSSLPTSNKDDTISTADALLAFRLAIDLINEL
jgi:hypothetical protein